MVKNYRNLMKRYFEDTSLVESNIKSFDSFISKGMQQIINEIGDVVPTIIPPEMEDFRIKLGKIRIEKPRLVEADGSTRDFYPMEARLRVLTYSAPLYLEVTSHVNGVQRESFESHIGRIPIMLRSKHCNLSGLKREEVIQKGEDPEDPGGYFILNGNERVLIMVEDLASNKLFIARNKTGPSKYTAKIFSERGSYRIPHTIEQMKDGIIYLTFTRFKRVPIIPIIKALGLKKDIEISQAVNQEKLYDDLTVNLADSIANEVKDIDTALEYLARKAGISLPKEQKIEQTLQYLDKYLLPHLGLQKKTGLLKLIICAS